MTTETTDSAMYVPHPTRRVVLRPFRVFNAEGVPYRNRRRFATAVDAAAWMAESGVSGFIQNQVSGVSLLPEEVARHQRSSRNRLRVSIMVSLTHQIQ